MRTCVFFDRDGIVNVSPGPGYVERWEDFHLQDGFVNALAVCRGKGYDAVIVTNQRGIARGIVAEETVVDMHARLRRLLREKHRLEILDVLYCPHHAGSCACRKPKPGMLLEAARRHDIDLAASWMIGDSLRDIQAGRAAGCRTILVGEAADRAAEADEWVPEMDELAEVLERVLGAPEKV